jgi:hypothetical protein
MLAIALLAQTVFNYRYVSNSLILQDAQRVAVERVRNVERAARLARPQDAEAFRAILDEVRAESADQVAGLALARQPSSRRAGGRRVRVDRLLSRNGEVSRAATSVTHESWTAVKCSSASLRADAGFRAAQRCHHPAGGRQPLRPGRTLGAACQRLSRA